MTALDTPLSKKNNKNNQIGFLNCFYGQNQGWKGSLDGIAFDDRGIKAKLLDLEKSCYIVRSQGQIGVTQEGYWYPSENGNSSQVELLMAVPPIQIQQLGDPSFLSFHGVKSAYVTGAMAGGIASEDMVIALGKEKILSSFGAGGLSPSRLEAAIKRIQQALPQGPYAFNLIHSPSEPAIERHAVD
ncbi:MAG: 2-nitropropane dioxygenase, partial [Moorea sp. SIO3I7]|nr:2-nitropropane dioxygenase [Moorena sp. SIO3I7]